MTQADDRVPTLGERIKGRRDARTAHAAERDDLRTYVDEQFAAVNARLDALEIGQPPK